MKTRSMIRFALGPSLGAAVALTVLTTSPDASAGLLKKASKGLSKGVKKVAKDTSKAAQNTGKAIAKTTDKAVDATGDAFSKDNLNKVSSVAKKNLNVVAKAGEKAYNNAVDEIKKGINAAKEAALKALAKVFVGKYKGFLKKFNERVQALAKDKNAVAIVDRLVKAASEKRLDDSVLADLETIGKRLGMIDGEAGSIVPGKSGGAMKSSWGLSVVGGGAYVGGAEGSFGFLADCFKKKNEKYGAAMTVSVGGVLGVAFGGSVNVVFVWQPGESRDAEGGYVGLGVEAAVGPAGGTAGVQWTVKEGMKGAEAGVPGFYLGWAGGVKAKAGALQGGYTFTPVKSKK